MTILLQLILTQLVTFVFSMFFPGVENFPETRAGLFVVIAGFSFATGVCLGGWLALRLGWLHIQPEILVRSAGALISAYLPLLVGLIFHRIEVGSPFFLIAILASILGFYIPGWIKRK